MFEQLKRRWKVNSLNLLLVICTFAIGGSLCGYFGRRILLMTGLEKGLSWIVLYIIIMTLVWPFCVLLVSLPLGQFSFFKQYLGKIGQRMFQKKSKKVNVAIFASGAGSNADKIIEHLHQGDIRDRNAVVKLIICNKPGAGVLEVARRNGIESLIIDRDRFFNGDHYLPVFHKHEIDFIVLAGFLWKVPPQLIAAYPEKMINIHPALLPKFGGKGMYGSKVHEAVIAAGEKESGITIHFVDELYDHGKIIQQATCAVAEDETPESLAVKIHELEHRHFPETVERLLNVK